ncbi:DsbE family thiol:disulfide interchange protein [Maritimibacter alexandrii]|uniref:DsbE family thiol:disulfide interchange protein n=1 Tax=Maritimibacter alexandrii TaxID=2570355 RepID=UPI001109F433|nr:DsbE family thiol:disulfide interchange protein [Maritimibacter alexandrii]
MKPLMILPPVVFAGLALMFYFGMNRGDDQLASTREGGPVPALTVAEFPGEPGFTVGELADGEVKLVNFWASWCAPCRAEHEYLMAFAEEGIPIYGINYKDEPANGRKFLDDLGNPFTAVVSDESGRTGIDWGLYGVPETFVVDGDGVIVKRFAGPITGAIPDTVIRPAIDAAR